MSILVRSGEWQTMAEIGRSSGLSPQSIKALAADGHIRSWKIPGTARVRYNTADVARLAPQNDSKDNHQ